MDICSAMEPLQGIATTRQLRSRGISERRLRRAVDNSEVIRISQGKYALPQADPLLVHALRNSALLTCVSAARWHGLWSLSQTTVPHLQVMRGKNPAPGVIHRNGHPRHGEFNVVDVEGAVLDTLRCLPPEEALVIAESAVRDGRVTSSALRAGLQGNRNSQPRWIVDFIDPLADSPLETRLRWAMHGAGLTWVSQYFIDGIGRVDFLVEGCVVVEVDGAAYHSDRSSYRRDRDRWNACTLRGWPTLRFTYEDILGQLPRVVQAIEQVVALARRR